jgi:predicted dehydrogenase
MIGTMQPNRRRFLMAAGITAAAATRVLGSNDSIRIGAIGCGTRMRQLLDAADQVGGYQLLAVCDVYGPRRDEMHERTNGTASTHVDYRELLDRKEVDAVIIAAPDHWHVRMACDALAAGKPVYLEKPVTHAIEEGEVLTRAARSSNLVLQCGMQQRSWIHFQSAVELIQGGNIGRVTQVRTYWYQNYQRERKSEKPIQADLLDWKRWLGAAPEQPFDEERFRYWRWFWDFGGGAMTDLFTHWVDVVHWAMKVSQPQLAQTLGDRYVFEQWQCPDTIQSAFRYPGFEVGYEGTLISSIDDGGLEFHGTNATLKIDRSGFAIYREGVKNGNPILSERSALDGTISHVQNFFDCIRNHKVPNAPVATGVAAARAGQLGNVALRSGNKVTWPLKS